MRTRSSTGRAAGPGAPLCRTPYAPSASSFWRRPEQSRFRGGRRRAKTVHCFLISFAPLRLTFSPSAYGDQFMFDPAARLNWIDAPDAAAPVPFAPPTDPPDEIDRALDALADAIGRANGGERRSMASHLARTPAVSKTAKVLSQLTASRLIAFIECHSVHDSGVPAALMPGIAASGAADRMARAQVFRRMTMAPRLYA